MRLEKSIVIPLLLVIPSILSFIIGLYFEYRAFLMIGLMGIFFSSFQAVKKQSIFATAFLINFFAFLCGRFFANWILEKDSLIDGAFVTDNPSDAILYPTIILIVSSILIFTISVFICNKVRFNMCNLSAVYNTDHKENSSNVYINKAIFTLFYITGIFKLLVILEEVAYVQFIGSYAEFYTYFVGTMPGFVYKIAQFNDISFYSVLALMASRIKTMPVISSYFILAMLTLLRGQRHLVMCAAVIIICYLLIRNHIAPEEKWITARMKRVFIFILPFVVISLELMLNLRNGLNIDYNGFIGTILNFFSSQGTTSAVVYYSLIYEKMLPTDNFYTLAPIIEILINNPISSFIFNPSHYNEQTAELAMYGNSFGSALLYIHQPYNYLAGLGFGTCYIAETFFEYGWLGLLLINFIYAFVLLNLENRLMNNIPTKWWIRTIEFIFINSILYSARNRAFGFLADGINFTVLAYCIGVIILAKILKKYSSQSETGCKLR